MRKNLDKSENTQQCCPFPQNDKKREAKVISKRTTKTLYHKKKFAYVTRVQNGKSPLKTCSNGANAMLGWRPGRAGRISRNRVGLDEECGLTEELDKKV